MTQNITSSGESH